MAAAREEEERRREQHKMALMEERRDNTVSAIRTLWEATHQLRYPPPPLIIPHGWRVAKVFSHSPAQKAWLLSALPASDSVPSPGQTMAL